MTSCQIRSREELEHPAPDLSQLKPFVCGIESDGFYYGYNKLTYCLKRKHGVMVNKKKVYRLLKEMNLLKPQRKIKEKHPVRFARNRVITASNQLWEIDLKYGYIRGEDRFFYVASILDVYDRSIISYHIGSSCTAKDVSFALKEGYFKRGCPNVVIRTDNGPQFKGFAFEETCLDTYKTCLAWMPDTN